MNTTLLIDDDGALVNMIKRVLTGAGYDVQGTSNAEEPAVAYAKYQPGLYVADLVMPDAERLRLTIHPRLPDKQVTLAVTGGGGGKGRNCLFVARKLGAHHLIQQPFSVKEFLSIVRLAIQTEGGSPR